MVTTPILGNLDLRAHEVAGASDRTLPRVVPGRGGLSRESSQLVWTEQAPAIKIASADAESCAGRQGSSLGAILDVARPQGRLDRFESTRLGWRCGQAGLIRLFQSLRG